MDDRARARVLFHDGTDLRRRGHRRQHRALPKDNLLASRFNAVVARTCHRVRHADTVDDHPEANVGPVPAYLAGGIGGQPGYIIAPAMITNPKGAEHPVGTGPFKFKTGSRTTTSPPMRNDHYWRKGLPYLDSVRTTPSPTPIQRANALEAGNIDIMHTDLPESILQFPRQRHLRLLDDSQHIVGEPDMNFVMCNRSDPVMKDIKVRQAMAMAINTKQYVAGHRQERERPVQPALRAGDAVLHGRRRLPGLQPGGGPILGAGGRAGDRQARGVPAAVDPLGVFDPGRAVPPGAVRERWACRSL